MPRVLDISYGFDKNIFRPVKDPKGFVGCKHACLILESNYYTNKFMECLIMTYYIFLIVLLKLGAHLLLPYNIAKNFIDTFQIAEPELWEYVWLVMVAGIQIIGLMALLYSNSTLMRVYCVGIYVSIGPLIWPFLTYYQQVELLLTPGVTSGFQEWLWQLMLYIVPFAGIENNQKINLWKGIPVGILVYGFLVVTILLNLSSGYYGLKLVGLYKSMCNNLSRIENDIDEDLYVQTKFM